MHFECLDTKLNFLGLPSPKNLRKITSFYTSLSLTYNPPKDYLTDKRYTHFIIRYRKLSYERNWLVN